MFKIFKKEKKEVEHPKCFRPNDSAYPLCKGAEHPVDFAEYDCIRCCIYEDYIYERNAYDYMK